MPNVMVALSGPALAAVRRVVNSAAVTLGRPVGVVDREFNQLARSSGDSPIGSPAQLAHRLRQLRGNSRSRPILLPADPAFATQATVWVPIRYDGQFLGYLWLLHAGTSLSSEETQRTELAVRQIASVLRHTWTDSDTLVRELLGAEPRTQQRAVRRALEEQPQAANLGVVALVVVGAGSQGLADAAPGYPLQLLARDHICVLAPCHPSDSDAVADRLAAAHVDRIVGIGQWYPHLSFAPESYREALGAARAAARLSDLGRVVRWTALGVYRTFVHLSEGTLAHSSIHPALERLFTEPAHRQLLVTLETYLDLAGNVALAAQRLHLHRASLYYRLGRIQELLQADLHDGQQRLCLHMAFKLGRFAGRYPLPLETRLQNSASRVAAPVVADHARANGE